MNSGWRRRARPERAAEGPPPTAAPPGGGMDAENSKPIRKVNAMTEALRRSIEPAPAARDGESSPVNGFGCARCSSAPCWPC